MPVDGLRLWPGLQMGREMKGKNENMREKDREGIMKLDMTSVLD